MPKKTPIERRNPLQAAAGYFRDKRNQLLHVDKKLLMAVGFIVLVQQADQAALKYAIEKDFSIELVRWLAAVERATHFGPRAAEWFAEVYFVVSVGTRVCCRRWV
ncbi:MAG: hypothetical protein ABJB74_05670 [Gemmatimonas sp.]